MTPPNGAGLVALGELAVFRKWGREVSVAFVGLSGGGSEMFTRIGDDFYVDPKPCSERITEKIDAARRLARTPADAALREQNVALIEALTDARAALHQHYVDWDGEPEDAVPLQLARAKCDAALLKTTGAE